ncbi:acetylxylan esterase [Thaumasiovibrio sp. DFM-14]|uniref:acetylxylan esterase n=1 Tax=Thaumasiovibrio sp. DFM-14 TaxID=3384792 RepID=UPI0039A39CE3
MVNTYSDTSGEPTDFLTFWEQAKEQVDSLPKGWKVYESNFSHPTHQCLDLYFEGVDKALIYAKYLRNSASELEPCPVIFVFHGYGESSPPWSRIMNWASAGFSVLAMDVRGQLGKSGGGNYASQTNVHGQLMAGIEHGANNLHFKKVYQDCYQLISIAKRMPEIDKNRMMTYGSSQGGALAIISAVLSGSINKIVSIHPFLANFSLALDMNLSNSPYYEMNKYFKLKDPSHKTKGNIFMQLEYIDVQLFSKHLKNKLLGAVTMKDDICPPEIQLAVFNDISSECTVVTYPEHAHEDIKEFEDLAFEFITKIKE